MLLGLMVNDQFHLVKYWDSYPRRKDESQALYLVDFLCLALLTLVLHLSESFVDNLLRDYLISLVCYIQEKESISLQWLPYYHYLLGWIFSCILVGNLSRVYPQIPHRFQSQIASWLQVMVFSPQQCIIIIIISS